MQLWQYCVYYQLQVCSIYFGRPLRPSSGALNIVTAATVVCHELGWSTSCIEVQGRLSTVVLTSGCCYSL